MFKILIIKVEKISKIENKIRFIQVFFIMFLIKLGMNLLPFSKFKSIYSNLKHTADLDSEEETIIISYIHLLSRNRLIRFTCLHQALTLKYFLKNDPSAQLIVGVNKTKGNFEAHAWIARENNILVGNFQTNEFSPIWLWK